MRSIFYVDEYGLTDITYLVHAIPIDPCPEESHEVGELTLVRPELKQWLIGLLFHVGDEAHRSVLTYPTRALRDQAFETLCTAAAMAVEQGD